ncbi:MAG: hypothetical protein EOP82_05970 [Variovorax sp.]|nr:MAG: hypothetical protein EOP82_05970 [Variovorax sp.]
MRCAACCKRQPLHQLENSALIQQALEALVQMEAARWLARLRGGAPKLQAAPRRRGKVVEDSR